MIHAIAVKFMKCVLWSYAPRVTRCQLRFTKSTL